MAASISRVFVYCCLVFVTAPHHAVASPNQIEDSHENRLIKRFFGGNWGKFFSKGNGANQSQKPSNSIFESLGQHFSDIKPEPNFDSFLEPLSQHLSNVANEPVNSLINSLQEHSQNLPIKPVADLLSQENPLHHVVQSAAQHFFKGDADPLSGFRHLQSVVGAFTRGVEEVDDAEGTRGVEEIKRLTKKAFDNAERNITLWRYERFGKSYIFFMTIFPVHVSRDIVTLRHKTVRKAVVGC